MGEFTSITLMLMKCYYNLYGKLPSFREVKYLEKFHLERDESKQKKKITFCSRERPSGPEGENIRQVTQSRPAITRPQVADKSMKSNCEQTEFHNSRDLERLKEVTTDNQVQNSNRQYQSTHTQ